MGLSLGLATLYYLWAPLALPGHISPSSIKPADKEVIKIAEKQNLGIVTVLASMYWITQLSAILYPGSKATDPEFGDGFPQLWIDLACFATIGAGHFLEKKRISDLWEEGTCIGRKIGGEGGAGGKSLL